MKPTYFIIAGIVMVVAAILLAAYVPPENPDILLGLGALGIFVTIVSTILQIEIYDDQR